MLINLYQVYGKKKQNVAISHFQTNREKSEAETYISN